LFRNIYLSNIWYINNKFQIIVVNDEDELIFNIYLFKIKDNPKKNDDVFCVNYDKFFLMLKHFNWNAEKLKANLKKKKDEAIDSQPLH